MRRSSLILTLATAGLVVACSDLPVGPESGSDELSLGRSWGWGRAQSLTVMTRNLYVGADVDLVIAALMTPNPNDDVPALLYAIETLGNTDFPARAVAIVDEIAKARPHVIGIQELSDIDIDLTALGLPVVIDLDFLTVLEAQLAARGLDYQLAVSVQNIEAVPIPGITLIDRDAIFVDAERVTVNSTFSKIFDFNVGVVAPGVELLRGWVMVDATIGGRDYTIVSTHLEPGKQTGLDGLRALQMGEIATALGMTAPAIVMGDLNDVPGSLMYGVLEGAGFTDVWAALRHWLPGYTCCHLNDLSNKLPVFDERIDQIWTRGLGHPRAGLQGSIARTGMLPSSRIDGPEYKIWPSDHAGVVAKILMPPARGLIAP